ncbi:hypothetical protein JRO89_XS04G0165300 [Xanthoceras sorbifolium]|uniref:EF-hand domain-containing protein n=1 Tax=Xanthoceras sorbifolium TaxID=99658 RepID=A0ABQ8I5K3_9ROSI|nr:hypothetical protein JRO89_XS04G0165300 [Xanthoceras sorbifolium]
MSDGGFTVLDGTQLRLLSLPLTVKTPTDSNSAVVTGAYVIDLVESEASSSLFGVSLPENLKSSALKRAVSGKYDVAFFRSKELDADHASEVATNYLTAIADELKYDPIVVSILDGNTLRLFLEDEDDFAMLAENLFTDLDIEDKGKICKGQMRNALVNMGVDMGIPPFSEFPLLNDILKKHGAEGEEELGQAQFAHLLQLVLQDVADAVAEKHVIVVQNIKIINGTKLRTLLADEKQLNSVIEKMHQEKNSLESELESTDIIRGFLEKKGKELGMPPSEANEAVVLLYDAIFADVKSSKTTAKTDDDFRELVKDILEKFAEQLNVNPVYHSSEY